MKVMKLNYENLFLTRYGYAQSPAHAPSLAMLSCHALGSIT
jgi:hypothetical protein